VTPLFGFLLPLFVYALVLALHLVVPARRVDGYVRDAATGRPLRYRLNGLAVAAAIPRLVASRPASGKTPAYRSARLREVSGLG